MTDKYRYDDGNWHAASMGFFISLLVDAGHDPAVVFRVLEDTPVDANGDFVRRIELMMVPNGYVKQVVDGVGAKTVHKVLAEFVERGLVK